MTIATVVFVSRVDRPYLIRKVQILGDRPWTVVPKNMSMMHMEFATWREAYDWAESMAQAQREIMRGRLMEKVKT